MSFKRMIGIISVVIGVAFSMMLSTSYAWYSFDNASTVFEEATNNDDIIISYQHGEYINTNIAIPISQSDVARYSEKNIFSIRAKDKSKTTELAVTISLVNIDFGEGVTLSSLQQSSFKIDLYHQSTLISSISGSDSLGFNGATTKKLGTVILDKDIANNFEIRLYILDDGTDQTAMMNQTFRAKVQIDVVSRLKTSFNDYSNSDIYISAVTIDGEVSDYIPTEGYYDMVATCNKGSNLTWEPLTKTITYNSGSYVYDDCSLAFTSRTDYPLLSEMPAGSYVKYTGTNGCVGKSCEGYNANYVSDTDMGYCHYAIQDFIVNGWRIGYVEDGSVHLVSAGAPECMCTSSDGTSSDSSCTSALSSDNMNKHLENLNNIALKYCNKDYVKGGTCITNSNDINTVWSFGLSDFEKITGGSWFANSCWNINAPNRFICGYNNDLIDNGGYYWFDSRSASYNDRWVTWVERYVNSTIPDRALGVRSVIVLDPSIYVKGGAGTYKDPFIISNGGG